RAERGAGGMLGERTRFRRIVGGYLRGARGSLMLAALSMLGLTLADLAKPWPLKVIIDNVLLGTPIPPYLSFAAGLFDGGKMLTLTVFSLGIFVIALLTALF